MERKKPLAEVIYIYDGEWSEYPETVRLTMNDGHVMTYKLEVKQPEPRLTGLLDKFGEACCVGGYKYKEKGRGKRSGRKVDKDDGTAAK